MPDEIYPGWPGKAGRETPAPKPFCPLPLTLFTFDLFLNLAAFAFWIIFFATKFLLGFGKFNICERPTCFSCRARRWDNLQDLPAFVIKKLIQKLTRDE